MYIWDKKKKKKKKKQRGQFVFLSITNDLYIDFIQQLQCKNCVNFNRG